MSSLLTKLADKGLVELDEHGADWLEKGLDKLPDLLPEGGSVEERALREGGEYAIAKLRTHKDAVARMGYQGAMAFMGRVAIGHYTEASKILLASYGGGQGAWGAADADVASSGDATEQAKRDQDAAIASAKAFGSAAAKAALPLLMALA